jgi:transcriptional regulator
MYRPDLFRVDDLPRLHALMRARPFAALISSGPDGLFATHLPTMLKDDGPFGTIECHVARANPHWKALGDEVLMIFQGPEGYITPNWYPSKAEHGKVVPTWNYAVVHAYGRPEAIEDTTWLRRHVGELTAQQEAGEAKAGAPKPWAVSDAPDSFIAGMARAIVGIRLPIARLEGKWKMSQNRELKDREGVIGGLDRRGEGDDRAIAEAVRRAMQPDR